MALFGSKKEKNTDQKSEIRNLKSDTLNPILTKPHVTEKATILMDKRVYAFEVSKDATKSEIKKAVKAAYNVTPTGVNIVNVPQKKVTRGRSVGTKGGMRKAYVYLKEGDKIELF